MGSNIEVTKNAVQARFGGVGFHNSEAGLYGKMTEDHFNQVICKTWRELSPGFSRIWGGFPTWSKQEMDEMVEYYSKMHKVTDTTIYLTGHGKRQYSDVEKKKWASDIADRLDYIINEKGMKHVKFYCMSNELSMDSWGSMFFELPTFKEYHTLLFKEFYRRGLPVRLLASDASPYEYWQSVHWCAANMDDINGIYGAHHYVNDFEPQDLDFYKWFGRNVRNLVKLADSKEKRFVLGEFGLAQDLRRINDVYMDVCKYFYNDQEAYAGLMICEMALAALNAGAWAMALWTFADYPNPTGTSYRYNKWGLTRWGENEDYSGRDWYYCFGLLAKYLKKESKPLSINTNDYLLRSGGVVNDDGTVSIAIINRSADKKIVDLSFNFKPDKPMRYYLYDSSNVPRNKFTDLQDYSELINAANNILTVELPSNSVSLLTTDYKDDKPAQINNIAIDNGTVSWDESKCPDHVYYRVYKGENENFTPAKNNQIASTVATSIKDNSNEPGCYKVKSVNKWNNEGV